MNGIINEGPPPPNKPRPPLVIQTTTVKPTQDIYPSGKKGPIERTVVTTKEVVKVKIP